MAKFLAPLLAGVTLLTSAPVFAGERTITLSVQNMDCATCPFVVRKSLEAVPGVAKVTVSFKDKTAVVTYEDSKANLNALTAATTRAGYPSALKS